MSEIRHWCAEREIAHVECLVPDFFGIAKGKVVEASALESGGLRIAESLFGQDILGHWVEHEELIDVADIDMTLVPDAATLAPQPWADGFAQCICDCERLSGGALEMAPRTILKRMVEKFAAMELEAIVAQEAEFYLLEPNPDAREPVRAAAGRSGRIMNTPRSFQPEALAEYAPFVQSLREFAAAQGIHATSAEQEMGQGQIEVNFEHGLALAKADEMFYFKRLAKEAALAHGKIASFMAKPMSDAAGSAMHLHQSLTSTATGKNGFVDKNGRLNKRFHAYLGGLQKYTPPAIALFAPSVNSFRRFEGAESCPTNVEWGFDNRSAGFRVPKCEAAATRIENRIPGADNNPYLTIAVSLACGYLGIQEHLKPSDPVAGSAWDRGFGFPRTLSDALDALENCEPLIDLLGERFVKLFVLMRRDEIEDFSQIVTEWEREHLLLVV